MHDDDLAEGRRWSPENGCQNRIDVRMYRGTIERKSGIAQREQDACEYGRRCKSIEWPLWMLSEDERRSDDREYGLQTDQHKNESQRLRRSESMNETPWTTDSSEEYHTDHRFDVFHFFDMVLFEKKEEEQQEDTSDTRLQCYEEVSGNRSALSHVSVDSPDAWGQYDVESGELHVISWIKPPGESRNLHFQQNDRNKLLLQQYTTIAMYGDAVRYRQRVTYYTTRFHPIPRIARVWYR